MQGHTRAVVSGRCAPTRQPPRIHSGEEADLTGQGAAVLRGSLPLTPYIPMYIHWRAHGHPSVREHTEKQTPRVLWGRGADGTRN